MTNKFTTKLVSVLDADRTLYDNIIEKTSKVPNLKTAITEFSQCIHHKRSGRIVEVYHAGDLVGASLFYTKNRNTDQSTTSLYSLFSIEPGAGRMAFDEYWKYSYENSKWFKFYVNKHAHNFYNKLKFSYWGVSKSGDNYSTFGRILSTDVVSSNSQWFTKPFSLKSSDQNYFEKNLAIFNEKHTFGYRKLKGVYKSQFDDNKIEHVIEPPMEII